MIKSALVSIWALAIIIAFLGFLIYILKELIPEEKKSLNNKAKSAPYYSLEEVAEFTKDSKTDVGKLELIIKSLIEYHELPPKDNGETPKKAKSILDTIFTLAGHRNMDATTRESMFLKLRAKNPEYKEEFNKALKS